MWKKREEKEVMALIAEHLEKVDDSLHSMLSVVKSYLQGDLDSAESFTSKTHTDESAADDIRREISDRLHRGAFLPVFREDVMNIVVMVDQIAAHAEACSDFIIIQNPDVPDSLKGDFLKLAQDSVAILLPLKEGVNNLSEDFSITREKVGEVHLAEATLDGLERKLARRIFSTDLTLAKKMHLKQLLDVIADIPDITEDVAEILDTLVAKKRL